MRCQNWNANQTRGESKLENVPPPAAESKNGPNLAAVMSGPFVKGQMVIKVQALISSSNHHHVHELAVMCDVPATRERICSVREKGARPS